MLIFSGTAVYFDGFFNGHTIWNLVQLIRIVFILCLRGCYVYVDRRSSC